MGVLIVIQSKQKKIYAKFVTNQCEHIWATPEKAM